MKRPIPAPPRNISSANPIGTGTVSFNSDGSMKNVNGAAPASGSFNLTIPWAASTGLASQTVAVNLGAVGGTSGLTQFDSASTLNGTSPDGSPFGAITGVTVSRDGAVTALFSNGLSQAVYKIPVATFTNPDGLGQMNGDAYTATRQSGAANINQANTGGAGGIAAADAGSLDGGPGDGVHQSDHHPACLFGFRAHRHHRRPNAAGAGTVEELK